MYPTTPDPYRSGIKNMSGQTPNYMAPRPLPGSPGPTMGGQDGQITAFSGGAVNQQAGGAGALGAPGNPAGGGVPDWMRTGAASGGGRGAGALGAMGNPAGGQPQGNTTFGPNSNLINTQFNPGPSGRTRNAQGATDQAKSAYQNYGFQGFNAQGPLNDSQSRSAFTGANDKLQQQSSMAYKPVAGTDLTGARNYLAQAGANLGPSSAASGLVGPGAQGSFGYSGDTGAVRGQTQAQLNKVLNTTPDRATLASNTMQRLIDDTNPQFQQDLRAVGKKAAALGRVGAGMTTSDLGDVSQRRNEQLVRRSQELADQAAGLSLQDQTDKLNAARGVTTDFGNMDTAAGGLNLGYQQANNAERGNAFDRARALGNDAFGQRMDLSNAELRMGQIGRQDAMENAGMERQSYLDRNDVLSSQASGLRNMGSDLYGMDSDAWSRSTSERDKGLQYDQQMFNNRRNIFGDMASDEQRLYGNDMNDLQFQRGERDYQYGLSRDAQQDSINERMMQEQLLNGRFNRGQGMFGAGYSTNPSGVMGQQGDAFAGDAASSYGALGDLFGSSVLNKRRPGSQPSYNGSF